MGNSTSTRRVTVVNDDAVGIIQISDTVVQRIKGEPEIKQERQKAAQAESRPQPAQEILSSNVQPSEPYSSTLEQRQKYLEDFRKAEISWQNRIDKLQEQNKELYESAQNKFSSSLANVEEKYVNQTCASVCPEKEQNVFKCYQENLKMPLKCSQEVKDFAQCVDRIRMNVVTNRG